MEALAKYQEAEVVQAEVISLDDVKKYIAPSATDKELFFFMNIAKSYGLNPMRREIHFVKYGQNPGQTIVGYESYIKRAERTGKLNGWSVSISQDNKAATITIYRKDWDKPFVWEVDRSEFDKGQSTWKAMPKFMLKKVAIAQGFRLAFSEELGGMPYISEEINGHTSEELPSGPTVEQVDEKPTSPKPVQKAPQKTKDAPQDTQTIVLCPENVGEKSGGTAQKPWTRTYFKHGGEWFSTFGKTLGAFLSEASQAGTQVEVVYKAGENGNDIISAMPVASDPLPREPGSDDDIAF